MTDASINGFSRTDTQLKYSLEELLERFQFRSLPSSFTFHMDVMLDKPLPPLNSIPMTEEEAKIFTTEFWSSNIKKTPYASHPSAMAAAGGRQARGRGRGRGGPKPHLLRGLNEYKMERSSYELDSQNATSSSTFYKDRHRTSVNGGSDEEIDSEEVAWNTPVGGSLGSFDRNGVFCPGTEEAACVNGSSMQAKGASSKSVKNDFSSPPGLGYPSLNSHSSIWLYRDPLGNIQGPFSSVEMLEWFHAGYFPPNLLLKRIDELHYEPLISKLQRNGNPFLFNGEMDHMKRFSYPGTHHSYPSRPHGRRSTPSPEPIDPYIDASADSYLRSDPGNTAECGLESLVDKLGFDGQAPSESRSSHVQAVKSGTNSAFSAFSASNIQKPSTRTCIASSSAPQNPVPNIRSIPNSVEERKLTALENQAFLDSADFDSDDSEVGIPAPTIKAHPVDVHETPAQQQSRFHQKNHDLPRWGHQEHRNGNNLSAHLEEKLKQKKASSKNLGKFAELASPEPEKDSLNSSQSSLPLATPQAEASSSASKGKSKAKTAAAELLAEKSPKRSVAISDIVPSDKQPLSATLVDWCKQQLRCITTVDIPTFCQFLADLESSKQVKDFVAEYAGAKVDSAAFSMEFVKRLNAERNGGIMEVFANEENFVVVRPRRKK